MDDYRFFEGFDDRFGYEDDDGLSGVVFEEEVRDTSEWCGSCGFHVLDCKCVTSYEDY